MRQLIFTQITEQLPYPAQLKGRLMSVHSLVIEYAIANFVNARVFKQKLVNALNGLSYCAVQQIHFSDVWALSSPLTFHDADWIEDQSELKSVLADLYISYDEVQWDIAEPPTVNLQEILADSDATTMSADDIFRTLNIETSTAEADFAAPAKLEIVDLNPRREEQLAAEEANQPTPKFHLLLGHSPFPQFDYNSIWFHQIINSTEYTMYRTLPEIPTNQSEITITTDPGKLTAKDRAKLFPNRVIHVRPQEMHIPVTGLPFDETLGTIIPISGFSEEQVRRNIIEYPHFHMLMKHADAPDSENFGIRSFGASIEIDGELLDLTQEESWEQVPDLNKLPRTAKFRNEYVIRRYLLERDIIGIEHKYPMYGALQKFLTLFMPAEQYLALGYDPDKIAEQCVKSRVNFYLTRNPILRMAYGDKVFQLMR